MGSWKEGKAQKGGGTESTYLGQDPWGPLSAAHPYPTYNYHLAWSFPVEVSWHRLSCGVWCLSSKTGLYFEWRTEKCCLNTHTGEKRPPGWSPPLPSLPLLFCPQSSRGTEGPFKTTAPSTALCCLHFQWRHVVLQNKIQTLGSFLQGSFPFPQDPIPAASFSLHPFLQTHTPVSSEGKDCGPRALAHRRDWAPLGE